MTTESITHPSTETRVPTSVTPASRGVGWLAVGVLALLWAYAVYRLGTLWHSNADYAYGWFMPLLCLCLFWERWKHR